MRSTNTGTKSRTQETGVNKGFEACRKKKGKTAREDRFVFQVSEDDSLRTCVRSSRVNVVVCNSVLIVMVRRSARIEREKTNMGSNKPENAWVDEDEVLMSEKARRTQTPQREADGAG